MNDVFVVTGISEGEKARLAKVNVCDITALEKNRYLPRTRKRRILAVLGLLDDNNESE